MSQDSPFMLFKVECPICKTVNEFESVRVGAYVENGRDTDFCPLDIVWRHQRYQAYNPLAFFSATCTNCFYTRELTTNYREWKNDSNFRTYRLKAIKEKHLDLLATADSTIKSLGESIDLNRYPNETAIIKLHLAIFDELLAEHPTKLDVGRFYLRIAWVFRTFTAGEATSSNAMHGLVQEVEKAFVAARSAFLQNGNAVNSLSRHFAAQFHSNSVPAELKSQLFPVRERFEAECSSLEDIIAKGQQGMDKIEALLNEYRMTALGSQSEVGKFGFGQFASFNDYLIQLKGKWSGVATNEREALEHAVHWYKAAYTDARNIAPGNQQIQASYLIAELSRRIGDTDSAREFFNTTIKAGQDFIYRNRQDQSRTALARKILELAVEQGRLNLETVKQ